MIKVRVPASTSNLGSGFDGVGIALDLWLEARLDPEPGHPVYSGTIARLPQGQDLIAKTLKAPAALSQMHLAVVSSIPVGKGLGSSAASLCAAYALNQLANGKRLDKDAVFDLAFKAEGHPDNAGPAVYGGFIVAAEKPAKRPFNAKLGIALAVPDSSVDTKQARALLPEQVAREMVIAQARRCASLVIGLEHGDGDLIRYGMEDQLAVPLRKSLIKGFDAAVAEGVKAGAYGVTISGSGSSLVAVGPKEAAAAIAKAMADAFTAAGNKAVGLTPNVVEGGMVAG
ncbi:MAG TPA: homoserine kinase [Gemmatimonadales bacterium]|jgi:homoserine kinase